MVLCDGISDPLATFIRSRGLEIGISLNRTVGDLTGFRAGKPHLKVWQPASHAQ